MQRPSSSSGLAPRLSVAVILLLVPSCTKSESERAKVSSPPQPATRTPASAPVSSKGSSTTEYIVVTNEDSGELSVVDAASETLLSTFDVGRRPRGIKASTDGTCVFVALSGSPKCPPTISDEDCAQKPKDASKDGIAQVDWRAGQVTRVYPGGSDPEQFDIIGPATGCKGTRLFIANEDVGRLSVVETDQGKVIAEVKTGGEPEGVRVSPDGAVVVVASEEDHLLTVIDTKTYEVLASVKVGRRPRDLVFSPSGHRLYVSAESGSRVDVVDMKTYSRLDPIALPDGSLPMGLALTADGGTLYVATGRARKLVAVDLSTNKMTREVDVGPRPWGIALSGDGRRVYTANGPSDDVSVVDTKTFQVTRKIKVGQTPWTVIAVSAAPLRPGSP